MGFLYGRTGCLTALFGGFRPGQWKNDHYLTNDRQMHELAFLYCSSLYDIRARSPALVSTCRAFSRGAARIEQGETDTGAQGAHLSPLGLFLNPLGLF